MSLLSWLGKHPVLAYGNDTGPERPRWPGVDNTLLSLSER